jgi:3-hydroxyisobutyrate dehydrogenase-like beta-hydroxyacid dehydrogenase
MSSALRIAVLGLGEAGSLIATDLVRAGADVIGWDPQPHGAIQEVPFAASFEAAIDDADVIVSVNWATVAEDVARQALPRFKRGALYADHNTSGPALKQRLAAIVEPGGAAFADVAMMSPVPPLGVRVPVFVAGSGAQRFAAIFRPYGMPVDVVGETAGEAAARKLVRSVFFKGMAAAVCESLEAARAGGIEEWMYGDIARTFESADTALVQRLVDGSRTHAVRRAHEMREVVALLREYGVPAPVSQAAVASLERLAGS